MKIDSSKTYDCVIVGGGPAGLSAAVYLGRFRRQVIIIDNDRGRSNFAQTNDNYLGFPDGITSRDLRERGLNQAKRFGVQEVSGTVTGVRKINGGFEVHTDDGSIRGKTILFANGVTDNWPDLPGMEKHIGTQIFWCITCDGAHVIDKRVCCIGQCDEAAVTTLQLLKFTDRITMVIAPGENAICDEKMKGLVESGIKIVEALPASLETKDNKITALVLDNGDKVPCDAIFSLLGITPNTGLPEQLGVCLDNEGYIVISEEGKTNIPGVFAAGDITNMYTQQVASAVHGGAEAAQTINYYLHDSLRKNPPNMTTPNPPDE